MRANGRIITGLLFVISGVLLLLNTLGFLDISVWYSIIRLWPVLLIAYGITIVGRNTVTAGILAAVLIIGAVLFGIQTAPGYNGGSYVDKELILEGINGRIDELILDMPVGNIRIERTDKTTAMLKYSGPEILVETGLNNGVASVFVRQKDPQRVSIPFFSVRNNWIISLPDDGRYFISVEQGVGQINVEGSNLKIDGVDLNLGVGMAKIALPETEVVKGINIEIGVGQTVIYLPKSGRVSITQDIGIGSHNIRDIGFKSIDGVYVLDDGEEIDIDISIGIGNIRVEGVK